MRSVARLAFCLALVIPGCFLRVHALVKPSSASAGGGAGGAGVGGMSGASTGAVSTGGVLQGGSGNVSGSGGSSLQDDVLDDFEDGDSHLLPIAGRNGDWHAATDGTGTVSADGTILPEKLSVPRGTSQYALHFTASGHTKWGASVGVNLLKNPGVYDLSQYAGILIWGRGSGSVMVQVRTAPTLPSVDGGYCSGNECYAHYAFQATFTSAWRPINIPFDQLKQPDWGTPVAKRLDQVIAIELQNATGDTDIDLWIDDIAMY